MPIDAKAWELWTEKGKMWLLLKQQVSHFDWDKEDIILLSIVDSKQPILNKEIK